MQLAQVPDRHEPNSDGEINYRYIFKVLRKSGYDGYIGLEYKPITGTVCACSRVPTHISFSDSLFSLSDRKLSLCQFT